ncbi:hypothetical protein JTE90_017939 [Oedothorax gibbosus]|uniref:Inosine/uridine-preferring nucleoside hydrolase domain-containing protein n=1 Tax=Oedothorax gibbosus TaxID=931172 RepID=A0AAV6V6R1_9ARAC|nr:hypothetical protein JTE90_017939 [Oedothorax gibbosus]
MYSTMKLAFLVTFVAVLQGGLSSPLSTETLQPTKFLVVDTDGGIDDTLALLLLLQNYDKTPILSITCLFGNTDRRQACDNVLRILALADRQGVTILYFVGSYQTNSGQQFSRIPAALALSKLSRQYPGAITLLALGPLTNLALAHRIDPYFTHNLREIVILGGNYNGILTGIEFNFEEDPLAANIILTEAACPVTLVPLETTTKNGIPWDLYPELAKTDTRFGHFFGRVSEVQHIRERQRGDPTYIVYDFVAAAVVLHPDIVTAEEKRVLAVEYERQFTPGTTVVLDTMERKPVRIVTDVNGTAIVELFRRMLNSM